MKLERHVDDVSGGAKGFLQLHKRQHDFDYFSDVYHDVLISGCLACIPGYSVNILSADVIEIWDQHCMFMILDIIK